MSIEISAGYVEDENTAYDMALAESPGWEFLSSHPYLGPREREIVHRQIGAASMLTQLHGYGLLETSRTVYIYDFPEITHEEHEEPPRREDEALMARWAEELPNVSLIGDRPVIRRADMEAFNVRNTAQAGASTYPTTHVTRVWNGLQRATGPKQQAKISRSDMAAALAFYDSTTALEAHIDPDEYTDLYGLFVLARGLGGTRESGATRTSMAFANFGDRCYDFVYEFVRDHTNGIGF